MALNIPESRGRAIFGVRVQSLAVMSSDVSFSERFFSYMWGKIMLMWQRDFGGEFSG